MSWLILYGEALADTLCASGIAFRPSPKAINMYDWWIAIRRELYDIVDRMSMLHWHPPFNCWRYRFRRPHLLYPMHVRCTRSASCYNASCTNARRAGELLYRDTRRIRTWARHMYCRLRWREYARVFPFLFCFRCRSLALCVRGTETSKV